MVVTFIFHEFDILRVLDNIFPELRLGRIWRFLIFKNYIIHKVERTLSLKAFFNLRCRLRM